MKKILSCVAVAGLLIVSSSSVFAGGHGGSSASAFTPAYDLRNGSSRGLTAVPGLPGAAGFAPGQQMQQGNLPTGVTANGPGASVWAPGFLKNK